MTGTDLCFLLIPVKSDIMSGLDISADAILIDGTGSAYSFPIDIK